VSVKVQVQARIDIATPPSGEFPLIALFLFRTGMGSRFRAAAREGTVDGLD